MAVTAASIESRASWFILLGRRSRRKPSRTSRDQRARERLSLRPPRRDHVAVGKHSITRQRADRFAATTAAYRSKPLAIQA
ncbi:MAG: hypothetical protein DLM63_13025 [Solirubrobacterales bacterium]|nr:MAG: hypothetical protein DLM63_13025 [Solirubrobacterales bacterium]